MQDLPDGTGSGSWCRFAVLGYAILFLVFQVLIMVPMVFWDLQWVGVIPSSALRQLGFTFVLSLWSLGSSKLLSGYYGCMVMEFFLLWFLLILGSSPRGLKNPNLLPISLSFCLFLLIFFLLSSLSLDSFFLRRFFSFFLNFTLLPYGCWYLGQGLLVSIGQSWVFGFLLVRVFWRWW